MTEDDWTERAACKTYHGGHDEVAFLERGQGNPRWAAEMRERFIIRCRTSCPVRSECLEAALAHEQSTFALVMPAADRHGIWGGYHPHTRERIARDRVMNDAQR